MKLALQLKLHHRGKAKRVSIKEFSADEHVDPATSYPYRPNHKNNNGLLTTLSRMTLQRMASESPPRIPLVDNYLWSLTRPYRSLERLLYEKNRPRFFSRGRGGGPFKERCPRSNMLLAPGKSDHKPRSPISRSSVISQLTR